LPEGLRNIASTNNTPTLLALRICAAPPVTVAAWSFICTEPERRDYRTLSPAFLEGIPVWLENPKMYMVGTISSNRPRV
jgi:hypothetical protein